MTDTLVGRLDKYAAEVQAATAVIKRQARIIDAHQQQIIDAGEIMKHWQSRALAAESSLSEAVKAEREACAKIAETLPMGMFNHPEAIASAIRSRAAVLEQK